MLRYDVSSYSNGLPFRPAKPPLGVWAIVNSFILLLNIMMCNFSAYLRKKINAPVIFLNSGKCSQVRVKTAGNLK